MIELPFNLLQIIFQHCQVNYIMFQCQILAPGTTWGFKSIKTIFRASRSINLTGVLTVYLVLSMPIRKINSAMKRLIQRFLWIVLRSLCSPRKKQKVKMQIARHTREMTIPTQVMTVRSNWWTPSLYWKLKRYNEH